MTFDGVDFVIDSGMAYSSRYYPNKDLETLELRRISKASHRQRRGRTGRTAPGTCYNLFSENEFNKFNDYTEAPIMIENLVEEVLKFIARDDLISHIDIPIKYKKKVLIQKNVRKSPMELLEYLNTFIERPSIDNVKAAITKIRLLGGLDKVDNKLVINNLGKGMSKFRTKPEWGRALIESFNYRCRDEMCDIIGFLSVTKGKGFGEIFKRFKPKSKNKTEKNKEMREYEKKKKKWASRYGDIISFLNIYKEFKIRRYDKTRRNGTVIKEKIGD